MAGIYLSNTVSLKHGTSATVFDGLLGLREQYRRTYKTHGGDGGRVVRDPVDDSLSLTLTFSSAKAADDFISAGEANIVVRNREFGGALRDYTIKNVKADGESSDVPDRQAAGGGNVSVDATATFGSTDTRATMITNAPGS